MFSLYKRFCLCDLLFVISVSILTACHFGEGDDELKGLAGKTRLLNYNVNLALPSLTISDTPIEDMGPAGLNVNWTKDVEIAVMGQEFVSLPDSLGESSSQLPTKLIYASYTGPQSSVVDNYTQLSFSFSQYAKHSIGEEYATLVNFVYPYRAVIDKQGTPLSADTELIPFDFTGQDGLLSTIRDKYYVGLGRARGVCYKSDVMLRDSSSCQAGHDHRTGGMDRVLLDSKMAVIRLSLVVPAQEDFTLLEFLQGKNMSGQMYYIDRIELSNYNAEASGFNHASLNLNTGWMQSQKKSLRYLSISDENHFWKHPQIRKEDAQTVLELGGDTDTSWGTSVYVAVPCTDDGILDMDPRIVVYVSQSGTTSSTITQYYGAVETVKLQEGCYYITTPIKLYSSKEKLKEPAKIYRTSIQ